MEQLSSGTKHSSLTRSTWVPVALAQSEHTAQYVCVCVYILVQLYLLGHFFCKSTIVVGTPSSRGHLTDICKICVFSVTNRFRISMFLKVGGRTRNGTENIKY